MLKNPLETVVINKKEGKELSCHRCGNIWTYKGSNPYVANCSYCKTTIRIIRRDGKSGNIRPVKEPKK